MKFASFQLAQAFCDFKLRIESAALDQCLALACGPECWRDIAWSFESNSRRHNAASAGRDFSHPERMKFLETCRQFGYAENFGGRRTALMSCGRVVAAIRAGGWAARREDIESGRHFVLLKRTKT